MPRPPAPAGTCTGPGPCARPARARGLCSGHLAQKARHPTRPLEPLGQRGDGSRVVLSLRVDPEIKERALADPDGARAALEAWAKR